jgi:hypothetical protein
MQSIGSIGVARDRQLPTGLLFLDAMERHVKELPGLTRPTSAPRPKANRGK